MVLTSKWGRIQQEIQIWHVQVTWRCVAVRELPKDVLKMASGLISPCGWPGHRRQLCIALTALVVVIIIAATLWWQVFAFEENLSLLVFIIKWCHGSATKLVKQTFLFSVQPGSERGQLMCHLITARHFSLYSLHFSAILQPRQLTPGWQLGTCHGN